MPLVARPHPITRTRGRQLALVTGFEPGPATLFALTLGPGSRWRLIASRGTIADFGPLADMAVPHFKLVPPGDVRDFLTAYAKAGGPHHCAVCFGDAPRAIARGGQAARRRLLRGVRPMFLGLDLGTTNVKALVADASGRVAGPRLRAGGACATSASAGVEQDIEEIWSATLSGYRGSRPLLRSGRRARDRRVQPGRRDAAPRCARSARSAR